MTDDIVKNLMEAREKKSVKAEEDLALIQNEPKKKIGKRRKGVLGKLDIGKWK